MMTHSIATNISSFPVLNIKITGWMEQLHIGCRHLHLQKYNGIDNRYNHRNRRKYSLKVHIVLVTKYRKQLLRGTSKAMVNGYEFTRFLSPPLVVGICLQQPKRFYL